MVLELNWPENDMKAKKTKPLFEVKPVDVDFYNQHIREFPWWPMIIAQTRIIAQKTMTEHNLSKPSISSILADRYGVFSIIVGRKGNFCRTE